VNWGTGIVGFLLDRLGLLPKDGKKRVVFINGKKHKHKPGITRTATFRRRFGIPRGHVLYRIWYGYRNKPQEIEMTCGYVEHGNQGRYKEEFVSRPRSKR
jgi:hypothetical protein